MESDINLFTFSKQLEPVLKTLKKYGEQNAKYKIYLPQIEENLVYKVLNSISNIYKTIKIDNMYKILSFIKTETCLEILLKANSS